MTESELIESAASKRALFYGEWIEDVYKYVKPLGRPTKDAILSVMIERTETFDGGVIATANHARQLCAKVYANSAGKWYRKTRFVESSHHHKLFQCYETIGENSTPKAVTLSDWDITVVVDYGHGMADQKFIEGLADARYLAVNVQTNSENYGFNLATKYRWAAGMCGGTFLDYLCVDEPEARLATQNRNGPIEASLYELSEFCAKVVVTCGKNGAVGLSREDGIVRVPAFTDRVIDTMGAGDAFFAVTALVAQQADMRSLLRIGNAAGAIKANIVGHTASVTKEALLEQLRIHP